MIVYILGFVIAVAIGLTGVGAGTLTTPLLILLVGLAPRVAVGTSLIFGFVVKIITAPVYMARKQVHWRTLAYMLAGGVPGVLIGVYLLRGLDAKLIGLRRSAVSATPTSSGPMDKEAGASPLPPIWLLRSVQSGRQTPHQPLADLSSALEESPCCNSTTSS